MTIWLTCDEANAILDLPINGAMKQQGRALYTLSAIKENGAKKDTAAVRNRGE
jgi:hypothetical protein